MSSVEQTLDEVAHGAAGSSANAPVLFVVLEGDNLLSRGARYSLIGVETVTLGREYVATMQERRLSKPRTALLAGGTVVGLITALAAFTNIASGSGGGGGGGPPR